MPLASFSARFAAFKVDILFFTILFEACHYLARTHAPELVNFTGFLVLYFGLTFFYYCLPTYLYGQTLGKKWLSIRVLGDRSDMTMKRVIMREIIGKTLSSFFLIGYFWFFRGHFRKTWHDILAKSNVHSNFADGEMTLVMKAQQQMVSIATFPVSLAIVLFIMLYTNLPLGSIRQQIELMGTNVGTITGSLGGGMQISSLSRHDDEQDYELKNVEVKFNLMKLFTEQVFLVEKLSAQSGTLAVPEGFTWWVLAENLVSAAANPPADDELDAPKRPLRIKFDRFKLSSLDVQNLQLTIDSQPFSLLQKLSVQNLEKDSEGVRVEEVQFQIAGLQVKAETVRAFGEGIQIRTATGQVTPELIPMLKKPIDFKFEGTISEPFAKSSINGVFGTGEVKFTYANKKTTIEMYQIPLSEYVKNKAPIETLSLRWKAEGASLLESLMKQESKYELNLCGATFSSEPGKFVSGRSGSQFRYGFALKPIPSFIGTLTSPSGTLDDFFDQRLTAASPAAPQVARDVPFANNICSYNPFGPPLQSTPATAPVSAPASSGAAAAAATSVSE